MARAAVHYSLRETAVPSSAELALSVAALYIALQAIGMALPMAATALPSGTIGLAGVLTIIVCGVAVTRGFYRPDACRDGRLLVAIGSLGAVIALAVLLFVERQPNGAVRVDSTPHIAEAAAAWLVALAFIRPAYRLVVGHGSTTRRILLIGDPAQVRTLGVDLQSRRGRLFDPIVYQDQDVSWPSLRQENIWGVVVASEPDGAAADALLDCKFRGMHIVSGATFRERYLGRIDLEAITANDLLLGQDVAAGTVAAPLKRLCDIIVAGTLLLLLLPLMAMTALAIKVESRGPVLDRQRRVGQFDTMFTLFKFRSMTAEPAVAGDPRLAPKYDPKITRIGRIIRAARIDGLPQLANVLRGDMSLVGPQPERPHFTELLARAIPFYRQRTYVKPGLTGWAQVNIPRGATAQDSREKLAFDLYYVKNRTIVLDIAILAATIRGVLFHWTAH